ALAPLLPYNCASIAAAAPAKSSAGRLSRFGAIWLTAAIMLATVSPVMVGADAASPQPTAPSSASMRTRILSARLTVSPAIFTGFFIGRLTAMGSMVLIRTPFLESQMRRDSAGRRSVPGSAAWRQAAVGLWHGPAKPGALAGFHGRPRPFAGRNPAIGARRGGRRGYDGIAVGLNAIGL